MTEGLWLGKELRDGFALGLPLGKMLALGEAVGVADGAALGMADGDTEGAPEGSTDGDEEGTSVGASEGSSLGGIAYWGAGRPRASDSSAKSPDSTSSSTFSVTAVGSTVYPFVTLMVVSMYMQLLRVVPVLAKVSPQSCS